MVTEDDTYVIHGYPTLLPLVKISLGRLVYDRFLANSNTHPALVDAVTGDYITYPQLLETTCSLAESLRRNGYGKNTMVSVSSENSLYFFIPLISTLYLGGIVAPINHNYTEQETTHTVNISQPKIIFCSKSASQKFLQLQTKLSFIEKIIIIDSEDEVPGTETMNSFIRRSLNGTLVQRFDLAEFDSDTQIAFVMCSSGTTGLPKGVMQTHSNLMVRYMQTIDARFTLPAKSFLGVLPFFHGFGMTTTFFAIALGQKIVVIKRFEENVFFKSIQDHRITYLWIAAALAVLLAKSPLVDKYDLSSLTELTSGAAPLGKSVEETLNKRLNIKYIRQGYGLTESTLGVLMMEIGDQKYGSSGKVAPYMLCKVRDPETGRSLGPGQVGELCFKGPMLVPGYYRNEQATKEMFTSDGWLLTGDLGYYDEDKYFFIVDRLKELIKYKGFQVAPAELEAILLSHPKIKDAGIVGVPDEEAGELPLAFVVKHDNVILSEQEIIKFVSEKVSPQKRLRGGVIFTSAIPKSVSGKILRKELRKMLTNHKAKL